MIVNAGRSKFKSNREVSGPVAGSSFMSAGGAAINATTVGGTNI